MERQKNTICPSVGDNETFVILIRVAQQDRKIRDQLIGILQQPAFHRKSLLNSFIDALTIKGAPPDFISAIACLRDDEVAEKALEIIKGRTIPAAYFRGIP